MAVLGPAASVMAVIPALTITGMTDGPGGRSTHFLTGRTFTGRKPEPSKPSSEPSIVIAIKRKHKAATISMEMMAVSG